MLEAKSNLLRLRQGIPLTEPELATVDKGLTAYEKLHSGLVGVRHPTVRRHGASPHKDFISKDSEALLRSDKISRISVRFVSGDPSFAYKMRG